jgi:hypothetical protein
VMWSGHRSGNPPSQRRAYAVGCLEGSDASAQAINERRNLHRSASWGALPLVDLVPADLGRRAHIAREQVKMEVRDVGPNDGCEHSFHGLALPKGPAELRRYAADTGGLRLFQIAEVINVALGRHEQMPEVKGQISVERGHVEREDDLVINERSTRNVDVPPDLTTHEAVLVGHGRSVIESRQKAADVPRRRWFAAPEGQVETSGLEPPTPCLQSRCSTD